MTCYVDSYLACSFCILECLLNDGQTALLNQWLLHADGLPSETTHASLGLLKL